MAKEKTKTTTRPGKCRTCGKLLSNLQHEEEETEKENISECDDCLTSDLESSKMRKITDEMYEHFLKKRQDNRQTIRNVS
jgi:hypothetical protein